MPSDILRTIVCAGTSLSTTAAARQTQFHRWATAGHPGDFAHCGVVQYSMASEVKVTANGLRHDIRTTALLYCTCCQVYTTADSSIVYDGHRTVGEVFNGEVADTPALCISVSHQYCTIEPLNHSVFRLQHVSYTWTRSSISARGVRVVDNDTTLGYIEYAATLCCYM